MSGGTSTTKNQDDESIIPDIKTHQDGRIRCLACKTDWIQYKSLTNHLASRSHSNALRDYTIIQARETANAQEQRLDEIRTTAVGLRDFQMSVEPAMTPRMQDQAEIDMWESYDRDNAGFDAGVDVDADKTSEKERIEKQLEEFGLWDAEYLGAQLGAEEALVGNEAAMEAEQELEDERLLAEMMQDAGEISIHTMCHGY